MTDPRHAQTSEERQGPSSSSLIDSLGFVSADSHVNEPRLLWRDNLPASMRSEAMQGIRDAGDGNWELILDSQLLDKSPEAEIARVRQTEPEQRSQVMREEGIVAECIYPTIGLYVWMLNDVAGGLASCRVYNEWMADTLARSPRFKCAGLVPTWRVEDAVAEVARIVDAGLGSIMLPAVAVPDWNHRNWEPLWSAIAETGLPIVIHQGTGHSMFFYRGPGAGVSNLLATQSMAPRTAALLATSGVLAAHPQLHFVFVEYNVGWLAWTMQTLDFYTKAFAKYGYTGEGKKWVNPELPELPSFYLGRQVHATFQDDPIAVHNIGFTGAAPLMWGSDYPHEEGTYPNSRATVARLAEELDEADATLVFRENAAKLFNFSDEVLTTAV
jgi:predicted TIM-barrel fold metal-dependent hydrolase